MPGSLSNPVLLDPWQAIVEVGWPAAITHVAFEVRLNSSAQIEQSSACSGLLFPEPTDPHWNFYLTGVEFSYVLPAGGILSEIYVKRRNAGWISQTLEQAGVTVSALPNLPPAVSYGAWDKVAGSGSWFSNHIRGGEAVWTPGEDGAELDVALPIGGGNFTDALSKTVDIRGGVFTGPPLPECHSGKAVAPCTGAPFSGGAAGDDAVSYGVDHAMSIAGITAQHTSESGKITTFTPAGSKLVGGSLVTPAVGTRLNAVWYVLFGLHDESSS